MLDNICSLPLSSDLFAHAIHPSEPIFSIGLSAGHVETFRLPASDFNAQDKLNSQAPRAKVGTPGRRLSENGFDIVDKVWRTRRHKGSCRTLAFSSDGETLYSAGTDGLIKAAVTATGRVIAKVAVTKSDGHKTLASNTPSVLHALSPQTLLLGSDSGNVHVYDLRAPAYAPSSRPSQSFRPHATPEDQSPTESISSLTPLPPTSASTSGTSRLWVSTSGSTLAVTDLRKGVVAVSEDQGDVLLSSACLPVSGFTANQLSDSKSGVSRHNVDKVIVGGMSGAYTIWDRGSWTDRIQSFAVRESNDPYGGDQEIEKLVIVPNEVIFQPGKSEHSTVAAGLSNGRVTFVNISAKGATRLGQVSHEEGSVDGISALGFDVSGRMISGGGRLVKIWHQKSTEDNIEEDGPQEANGLLDASDGGNESSDINSDDDDESRNADRPRKKKKQNSRSNTHGNHGIMAFEAMD